LKYPVETTCAEDTAHRPWWSEQKKTPSFGRKTEARCSGDCRDSDSCFGSKVRLDIAVCDVLALIDMAICVTPQQRLIGRALYSHVFLLGHAERVSSIRHESRHLPQPRTPVIMGPGLRRDDVACVARSHRMHCLAFNFQTAYFRYHFASRVPDAVQRSSRCSAEPGPKTVQDGPRISSAPRREVRRAAQHPGHASPTLLQL
jgi:hypothetical protein